MSAPLEPMDPDWLRRQYVEKGLSASQIAVLACCSRSSVYAQLQRHGIPRRPISQARYPELRDEEWLRARYTTGGLSAGLIALELGCTPSAVEQALRRHGIKMRSQASVARAHVRRMSAMAVLGKREAQRREAKAAAKAQGGWISEAYSLAERMARVLDKAHAEATDRDARRALSLAGSHYREMRDEIVRALGVS